ncbi:hypothetical protein [Citrobacter freundii]|uniref:hypothetical protein n=1 Tax=Citrobacter freundii TaxID=546 RepID=UPI002E14B73E
MALSLLAANNAQTVLAAGISSTATSLTVNAGTGTLFPSPVAGTSFFKLTIIDAATGSLTEIIHVTARNGDVFTIQRGQEGTVPRAWSANDIAANMMTAGTLSYILGNFQPLDPTLTALATLVGAANKLPYFNGDDTAALTNFTQVGRDIIGKNTIADILTYLGLDRFVQAGNNPHLRLILDASSWYVYDDNLKKNIALAVNMGGTGALDAAGARTNLELGNSATKNTGTTQGTVAAGDDSRITGALQKTGGDVTGPLRRVGSYPNILLTDSTMDDATIGKTVGIEQSKGRLTFYLRSGDGSSSSGQVLFNMPDITGSKTLITKEECDVRYQQQTRLGAESRYGANDNYIAVPAGCVMTGLDVGGGPASETFIGYRPLQVNINDRWATVNQL